VLIKTWLDGWGQWYPIYGPFSQASSVSAVACNLGRLDIFAVTPAGQVYTNSYDYCPVGRTC